MGYSILKSKKKSDDLIFCIDEENTQMYCIKVIKIGCYLKLTYYLGGMNRNHKPIFKKYLVYIL